MDIHSDLSNWTDIPGFAGKYQININGIIVDRIKNREITISRETSNYLRCVLNDKRYYVHRLIALTFIPNPEEKTTVNHINGVKDDNRIENLEWLSIRENNDHAYSSGITKYPVRRIIRIDLRDGSEKRYISCHEATRDLFPELTSREIKPKKDRIMRVIKGQRRHYKNYVFRYDD